MKTEYKVIALSIILGLFLWIIDAVVDDYFFREMSFWESLIVSPHEVYMRSFVSACVLISGLLISRIFAQRECARKELQQRREWLEVTLSSIGDAVIATDTTGSITFMNPVAEETTGWSSREASGQKIDEVFHIINEQTRERVENPIERVLAEGITVGLANHTVLVAKDGREIPILDSGAPIRGAAGTVLGVVLVYRDITRRRQAEEELRRAAEDWERTFDAVPDLVALIDDRHRIVRINRAMARRLKVTPREAEGLVCYECVHGLSEPPGFCPFTPLLKNGREHTAEMHEPRLGGDFIVTVSPLYGQPGQLIGCVHVARDITERKRMERELIRLERLRAIGELSAGVSHNLNNILTGIMGPAQLLQRFTDDPAVLQEVEEIIKSTRRARDLVHRLYLSTRGVEEDDFRPVQVHKMIRDAVQATRPRWKDEPEAKGSAIEVVLDLKDVPAIKATDSGLNDIFINLLFNAVDAMPAGGTITVRTETVEAFVQITVSDTGIGMDEETRNRVFEPFFTTKRDVGSGLGLSTAYNTVIRWGGTLDVESAPGEGTTFVIRLPIWAGTEGEGERRGGIRQARPGKLLIVEDDETVFRLLSRLLSRIHEVEAVPHGREALEVFAPGRYDVALVDLGMPEMPGDQLVREMHRLDPLLVTVLMTGWEMEEGDSRMRAFDFRIRKPFADLSEVEDVVARAIELHDAKRGGRD